MSMHSISGSSIVGKYERELTYTLNPARPNNCTVESWREPFGMPSLSFIVSFLAAGPHPRRELTPIPRLGMAAGASLHHLVEARALAGVAHVAVAEPLHLDQHRIVVAIGQHLHDLQPVAGCFALH